MRLRVNNGRSSWYDTNTYVEPLIGNQPLIVAIDQSKTNCAIIVGTTDRKVIHIAEASGNDPEFYERAGDTTTFCVELTDYLAKLLGRSTIHGMWQEKPIFKDNDSKWYKGKKERGDGYSHFKSQLVLTEIRAALLNFSIKLTGEPSKEVINTEWKGKILPDGYRGQKEKGSWRYLSQLDPKWINYTDDVTDALCIYLYAIATMGPAPIGICNEVEKPVYNYILSIVDSCAVPKTAVHFQVNSNMTCEDNAIYFSNRASGLGAAKLDVMKIPIKEIYTYAVNLYTMSEPYLLVKRLDNT